MSEKFIPYAGLAKFLNTINEEKEVRVFLAKYKQWYIKEYSLSREEAKRRVVMDLRFFIERFIKDDEKVSMINKTLDSLR